MYTIYKYDWQDKNRLGASVELVYPTSKDDARFVCVFDTDDGVDIRLLRDDAIVAEYASPMTQHVAAVFKAKVPFFSLGELKRRTTRLVLKSCFHRFLATFCGRQRSHARRRRSGIEPVLADYTWTPYEGVATILM